MSALIGPFTWLTPCSLSLLRLCPLQIPPILIKLEFSLFNRHLFSILGHNIFNGHGIIRKNLQMIGNQVTVLTSGTLDQNGASMVGLMRHLMSRRGVAFFALERNLVHGRHLAKLLGVLGVLGILGITTNSRHLVRPTATPITVLMEDSGSRGKRKPGCQGRRDCGGNRGNRGSRESRAGAESAENAGSRKSHSRNGSHHIVLCCDGERKKSGEIEVEDYVDLLQGA